MDFEKGRNQLKHRLFWDDALLILIMATLAACGLIYEYLLSHYAGRVLGTVETAIYAMIGLMIVSMGLGAFAARWFKSPFTAFAWLEIIIAMIGMSSILVIASLIAVSHQLPYWVSTIFNLPEGVVLDGHLFSALQKQLTYLPYVAGFVLGFLIGMEIPLIARVRQAIHDEFLENNAGTIYGADYIGAGFGAALWVMFMLSMDIASASALTAALNIVAGFCFIWRFNDRLGGFKWLLGFNAVALVGLGLVFSLGNQWMQQMTDALYKDHVIYSTQTNYQHIAVTERTIPGNQQRILDLYLNGRLQFSSADEHIYHSMLVYPAMAASNRHDNILVIGGGDGLALRNILRWNPQSVTLIDLDEQLVNLFQGIASDSENAVLPALSERFLSLNDNAFLDKRVTPIFGDAFVEINALLGQQKHFDTIIIDLPDPSHPDLNKLYSDYFYNKVSQLLNADGVMVIQSTSPFHAPKAFKSIGKTLSAAGLTHVEQYRQNIPSFGEWGWTIGVKQGVAASQRLSELPELLIDDEWVTKGLMLAAFEFPANFYEDLPEIQTNYLGSGVLYQYHYQAWLADQGVFTGNTRN